MAKRIFRRIGDDEAAITAAPLPFDPGAFYTDEELAAKVKVHPRTIKRWRSKSGTAQVEFSSRTKRTLGRTANQIWQSKTREVAIK
jgi:hypothetical protein